jgi:hypothetical protein
MIGVLRRGLTGLVVRGLTIPGACGRRGPVAADGEVKAVAGRWCGLRLDAGR